MSVPAPPPVNPALAGQSHLAQIMGVETVFIFLVVTISGLRLYTRLTVTKGLGIDDWTMAGASLCALATYILFAYQAFHGLGRHIWFISPEDQTELSKTTFWQVIISSCLGMALLKSSVALSLVRLSPGRWYVWCLRLTIAFVCAYSFMGAMTFFLFCKPMSAYWNHAIKGAKCYSISLFIDFALINTSFTIFTDVLLATVPIPIIWKLQMKRRVKLYLIGALSLGYMAVGFGVANGVYQISYAGDVDAFYNDSIMFFATLQVNMGIIAACIPTLKPLVGKALKLTDFSNSRQNYGSRYASHYGSHYGNQSHSRSRRDQYALEELGSTDGDKRSDEIQFRSKAAPYSTTITTSENNAAQSDEMISGLQSQRQDMKGIFVRTEVIVD